MPSHTVLPDLENTVWDTKMDYRMNGLGSFDTASSTI
jgi:hypothetical protein